MTAEAPAQTAFVYEAHPTRALFGAGVRAELGAELERLGVQRVLLVASPRLGAEGRARVAARVAAVLEDAAMHVPAQVAARACSAAREARADGVVALGGGSAVGLAKAVAREQGLPIVALPTTYAGSEMTSIWGRTEGGRKETGRDARVRPRTVLYDAELAITLPQPAAAASGMNALAHAMEALYGAGADPTTPLFAEDAARRLARHLPRRGAEASLADVGEAQCGAWLAGMCLDRARMGVHHKLCHVLGGSFGLPHAETHAVLLPHAAAYNREAAPDAMRRLAAALGAEDAPAGLFALGRALGTPSSLAALGMKEGNLDAAAAIAVEDAYANPRPVDRASLRALLDDAFAGRPPR